MSSLNPEKEGPYAFLIILQIYEVCSTQSHMIPYAALLEQSIILILLNLQMHLLMSTEFFQSSQAHNFGGKVLFQISTHIK